VYWLTLRAQAENEGHCETLIANLYKQLEAGKEEIWQAHYQVTERLNQEERNDGGAAEDEENVVKTGNNENDLSKHDTAAASNKSAEAAEGSTRSRSNRPDTIHVVIVQGYYEGNTYDLTVKAKQHVWVGRSQGKKFKENGISLHKDSEVSTSHGRFEYHRGKLYYLDAASTNGSLIGDEFLEPNVPYELQDGMYITVGQTVMQITLTRSK
jgi:hypothetical protein